MVRNLVLIGFMGSGKSAVGQEVAQRLKWQFTDTDAEVAEAAGMSIPEIFELRGEAAFRQMEGKTVARLLERGRESGLGAAAGASAQAEVPARGMVISLGGGAVTIPSVAQKLRDEPFVVLLDIDIDTAYKRAHGKGRPLAQDEERFHRLFDEREGLYRSLANFVVDTRGREVAEVAGEVAAIVKESD